MSPNSETSKLENLSLTACIAHVLNLDASAIPDDGEVKLRQWLALGNLGLVPVESPEEFSWPGHFLGRRRDSGMWVVLFGVPPGVVFDPSENSVEGSVTVDAAFVLAAHDPQTVTGVGRPVRVPNEGVVEMISLAEEAEAPMKVVQSVGALSGRGLKGDRYAQGGGTFSDPNGQGYDLTLVEAEALEELTASGVELAPADARRNIVVRGISLDGLIGKSFRIGDVECFGQRRCEPCAHLERLTQPGVLRGLVHRGGLRADIISGGEIQVGDSVAALR